MKNNPLKYVTAAAVALTPVVTFAAGKTLSDLIIKITGYLNQALVLLMGLAVVVFVWYIFQYFIKPDDDRKNAGNYVMYSLIGFFIILSFWGLVNILRNTFDLDSQSPSYSSIQNLFPSQ